jgi:hypothetical protein
MLAGKLHLRIDFYVPRGSVSLEGAVLAGGVPLDLADEIRVVLLRRRYLYGLVVAIDDGGLDAVCGRRQDGPGDGVVKLFSVLVGLIFFRPGLF